MGNIVSNKFNIILTYEMSVDADTGEVLSTNLINRDIKQVPSSSPKKKEVQDDGIPRLTLDNNKYTLNSSAVELMGITQEDKIDIKYETTNDGTIPVIGTDSAFGTKGGNRLTKSNTVAYRGVKNEELAKYGNQFILSNHPVKEGLFVLTSETNENKVKEAPKIENETIRLDTEDIPFDLDLDGIDVKDANVSKIDSELFQL